MMRQKETLELGFARKGRQQEVEQGFYANTGGNGSKRAEKLEKEIRALHSEIVELVKSTKVVPRKAFLKIEAKVGKLLEKMGRLTSQTDEMKEKMKSAAICYGLAYAECFSSEMKDRKLDLQYFEIGMNSFEELKRVEWNMAYAGSQLDEKSRKQVDDAFAYVAYAWGVSLKTAYEQRTGEKLFFKRDFLDSGGNGITKSISAGYYKAREHCSNTSQKDTMLSELTSIGVGNSFYPTGALSNELRKKSEAAAGI